MNKCDYCEHVEMCGWRKSLEEGGCEFFDDGKKWISVSERLPEELESVLAYDGTDMFVAWYFNKKWSSHDSQLDRYTPIIAWMPLPEPYEEESEE